MKTLKPFIFFLLVGIVDALAFGFVIAKLWNWLLAPTMAWPVMGAIPGAGLRLIFDALKFEVDLDKIARTDERDLLINLFFEAVALLFLLGGGWIIQGVFL